MNAAPHAVLVTGTSTGIGRATALRLARGGRIVFAGVRREEDARSLAAEGGASIRPLLLDVTDTESIARAVATIRRDAGAELGALVNNAGAAVAGPLEILPLADVRRQFELNFFAPIALVRAVLPLLRETRGRIVNVSSIGGKIVTPYVGAYSASKYALEAASDALRVELRPFGVDVVLIEPGAVKTPIWQRAGDASTGMLARVDASLVALYRRPIAGLIELSRQQERTAIEPDAVAAVIERALTARRPRTRYLVGTDARVLRAISRLPDAAVDAIFRTLFERYARVAEAKPDGPAARETAAPAAS